MRTPTAATLALALASGSLLADSVTLNPDADTGIIEDDDQPLNEVDDYNLGSDQDIPVGTFGSMNMEFDARGLFRFDIAAAVPAGATITGGRIRATVSKTPNSGAQNSVFVFHRLNVSWQEGVGSGGAPGGRIAEPGETTWNNRMHDSVPWTVPGGLAEVDFDDAVSASEAVTGTLTYVFELNVRGIADVQGMLDAPATNHGWLFRSEEEGLPKTARRWFTREAPAGSRPELEIEFTPPPPPPDPPELTFVGHDGANLIVRFLAEAGVAYTAQVADALDAESWTDHSSFNPIENGEIEITIPSSGIPRIFVRVEAGD